jgi:hypothetical protein
MTTVATVQESPAASQLIVRLEAAAALVEGARALIDEGKQSEALALFKAAYARRTVELTAIVHFRSQVLQKMKENGEAGRPVNPLHVEELVELRVEEAAAMAALSPEAKTISHAIFALDLLEA